MGYNYYKKIYLKERDNIDKFNYGKPLAVKINSF